MARSDPKLGAKLGPRVAQVAQRAMQDHYRATRHDRSRVGAQAALTVFRVISQKTRGTIGEHAAKMAEAEGMPPWAARTFRFIASGSGEWQALLSNAVYGSGVGSSITAVIVNEIAPAVQALLAKDPHSLIPPGGIADAYVKGLVPYDNAVEEAKRSAISEGRFDIMAAAVQQFPDLGSALELLRRGEIDEAGAVEYLRRQNYPEGIAHLLLRLRRVEPSVADAALQVIKGVISQQEGRDIARRNGYDQADFDNLTLMTGEPPGIQDLLFLYRRGLIDRARLDHGIRQSRVRDEWVDAILDLRFVPASTADAIRAVVQNHLTDAEGRKIAEENGLMPEHWPWMVESAGRPPGPEQMLSLWARGEMTEAEVRQGIRESDIKNKYIGHLLKLKRRLIPERQLVQMVQHGTMTETEAAAQLAAQGYDPADAKRIIHLGASQRSATDKGLAKTDTLALYQDHLISKQEAEKMLAALGHTEQETAWMLQLEDLRRARKFHEAAIGRIGTLYIAHHLDDQQASGELDALGVDHTQRDALLGLWTLERAGNAKLLTQAQITAAYKAQLLDQAGFKARLTELGYRPADIEILLGLAGG